MNSNFREPINIGSSETISIQELYDYAAKSCGVVNPPYTFNLNAPIGVLGRSSNNDLCLKVLDWEPNIKFKDGITKTANWISSQAENNE
jgi:nucleoside-diphosphate-sugar epimerase